MPEITLPNGENPWLSRNVLLPKLMKSCVVRVFGPAVANVMVPGALLCLHGSSLMFAFRHTLLTDGSALSPNCTMNPGTLRKNAASVKYPCFTRLWNRSAPNGDHARVTSTVKSPFVVANFT